MLLQFYFLCSIDNLSSIVEDYGCDYEDAFCAIAEENQIDPDALAVSVEDWKLIETPELVVLVAECQFADVERIEELCLLQQVVDVHLVSRGGIGGDCIAIILVPVHDEVVAFLRA